MPLPECLGHATCSVTADGIISMTATFGVRFGCNVRQRVTPEKPPGVQSSLQFPDALEVVRK